MSSQPLNKLGAVSSEKLLSSGRRYDADAVTADLEEAIKFLTAGLPPLAATPL